MITAPAVAARLRAYGLHTEGSASRVVRALQNAKMIGKSPQGGPPDRAARLDPAETVLLSIALILPQMDLPTLVDRTWELFRLGAGTDSTAGDALVAMLSDDASDIAAIIIGSSAGAPYARIGGTVYGAPPDAEAVRHETLISRSAVKTIAALVKSANED